MESQFNNVPRELLIKFLIESQKATSVESSSTVYSKDTLYSNNKGELVSIKFRFCVVCGNGTLGDEPECQILCDYCKRTGCSNDMIVQTRSIVESDLYYHLFCLDGAGINRCHITDGTGQCYGAGVVQCHRGKPLCAYCEFLKCDCV